MAKEFKVTPEIQNFDYGSIKKEHKEAVQEILSYLKERSNIPTDMLIEDLKLKWQLEEIPMLDEKETLFWQFVKDEPIKPVIQGWTETTDENGKKIRIPYLVLSADMTYFDHLVKQIIKKSKKIKVKLD
jgi:hypothetical protein